MYANKKVRDIMVPISEYPVICETAPVAGALRVISDFFHKKDGTWYGFQSVLVVNEKDKLVGIITLRSFLKAFKIQSVLEHILTGDPTALFFLPRFHQSHEIQARDIMRPLNLITVQADSNIFSAMVSMVEGNVNSLPVLSGTELVGVVRTIDLFWAVGEYLE